MKAPCKHATQNLDPDSILLGFIGTSASETTDESHNENHSRNNTCYFGSQRGREHMILTTSVANVQTASQLALALALPCTHAINHLF